MKPLTWMTLLGLMLLAACGGKSTPTPESAESPDMDAPAEDTGASDATAADESGGMGASETPDDETEDAVDDTGAESSDVESEDATAEAPADGPPPSANLEDYMGSAPPTPEYKTVQENMKAFKFCYLDAMRSNPDLQGTIRIRFTVNKAGKVPKAKAIENELNKAVETCVLKELKKLQFPKRDSKRTVEYPFKFIPAP